MSTSRLETFSDGVLAIIITIMVLQMAVPQGTRFLALGPLLPMFASYILSFVYLGIFWSNHHRVLQGIEQVNGVITWANLHLLFWLPLVPFVSGWMGEKAFAPVPTAVYGGVLLMAALAFWGLRWSILRQMKRHAVPAAAPKNDFKARLAPVLYIVAIPLALRQPWLAGLLYAVVAVIWVLPDQPLERRAS
jgi:uncharacterized membrane protein